MLPRPATAPAMMTVPLDMACSGVPVGAPTSRPSWVLPHRGPYPEVMFHLPMGRVQRLASRSLFAAARALASAAFVRPAVAAASLCARAAATAAVRLASRAARCVASARPWRALASIVAACRRAARSATCASSAASSACKDDPLVDGEGEGGAGRSGLGEASLGATGLDRGCPTAGDHQGRDRGARQEPGTGAECPTQAHGRSGGTVAAGIPALGGGKDHGWRPRRFAGPSTVRGRPVVLRPPSTACG